MPLPENKDAQMKLVFTGERFVPHQTDPLLALEHYHRYWFASRLAQNKKVLDMACGEGYGSALLSKYAGEVVGIDIDEAAVEHAQARYSSIPNLRFESGRCEDSPKGEEAFDMVVSFELLEHLNPDSQVGFLQNVQRLMKQDGILVISSPERHEYAATYQTRNEFHKHELTLPEFRSFLGTYFKHVHLSAQRVLFLSTMWELERWREAQFRFHHRKDLLDEIQLDESLSKPLYLIAVCSNAPVPASVIAESNSFYLDTSSSDQAENFSRWAQQMNSESQKARSVIQDLQRQMEDRTAWAMKLDGIIKGKDEAIETVKGELESRTKWAFSLQSDLENELAISKQLQTELDDRSKWALSLESELTKEREAEARVAASFGYRLLAKMKLIPRF